MDSEQERTLYCGNLSEKVTEELLYELFLQAGPIESVRFPNRNGKPMGFGFVIYKHRCTIPYALDLYEGTTLYGRSLKINSRTGGGDDSRRTSAPTYNQQRQSFSNPETPVIQNMNRPFLMNQTPSLMDSNPMFLPVLQQQLAAFAHQGGGTPILNRQYSAPEPNYNRNSRRHNEPYRRREEPYRPNYNNRNRR